jgi:hypothetical protein
MSQFIVVPVGIKLIKVSHMVVAYRSKPDHHIIGTERVNVREAGVLAAALRVWDMLSV